MRNLFDQNTLRPCIALDIETVSNDRTDEYIDNYKTFEAPGNYKKQEAINDYIEKAKGKERSRAALYIPTQKIWVVCCEHIATGERVHFESSDERTVISHTFNYLNDFDDHVLFGFNTRSFDFPALVGAGLRHSITLPKQLRLSHLQSDILDDFYHTKIRLQDVAFTMGMEKTMDGGDVGAEYLSYVMSNDKDAKDRVVEYCYMDTHICAEYVRRLYL